MVEKRPTGVKIGAYVEGAGKSKLPLKAVLFTETEDEIKILAEKAIDKDEFELDLKETADKLPEKFKLAIVPKDVKNKSHINRLAVSEHAPSAIINRDFVMARDSILTSRDLRLASVERLMSIWPFTHRICGRVIKTNPVTGEVCYVPGAKVTVYDVDLHLLWHWPYKLYPWGWIYPFWPHRREEMGSAITDRCGRFCLYIPYFDIDAIIRWRLRFRCLYELLRWPRILDAIELGVKPDVRYYPELEKLPELQPIPKPGPGPDPGPLFTEMSLHKSAFFSSESMELRSMISDASSMPKMPQSGEASCLADRLKAIGGDLFGGKGMFDAVEPDELPLLERPAFPESMPAPPLPEEDMLKSILPYKEMIPVLHEVKPLFRLFSCWVELVPEIKFFLDVPDIVFKVEQDIDNDGDLETIYDQNYFNVNWNLNEPTTNVIIKAWKNALCVPCEPGLSLCTPTGTGIVALNDMSVDTPYLSSSGYAIRVNRPKPVRVAAETPFCHVIRIVGCPQYGTAKFYRVRYKHQTGSSSHFMETWYIYNYVSRVWHHVVPDPNGYYPVLPNADEYVPYHTLINWRTGNYENGRYEIELELYDNSKNSLGSISPINVVIDNSTPNPLNFLKLEWRVAGVSTWTNLLLHCPIIERPKNKDIELRVTYDVGTKHLRDFIINFAGCGGNIDSSGYWHQNVHDNYKSDSWEISFPKGSPEGAYRFYLEGRSRAFNATGGLASNWEFDTIHIRRGKALYIAIIDK